MKKKRQAVVIIHGIGEQRPMKTLRSFVTSLLNYEKSSTGDTSKERTFWTKPDRISNSYELRKISSKGSQDKRSTTHFYEYHWAANMRDTKWRHILRWFGSLMLRDPFPSKSIRLLALWLLLWSVFLSWIIITGIFLYNWLIMEFTPINSLSFFQKTILAIPIFLFLLHNIFIGFIGDAARYLRVDVENIQQRETIRKNGVDLLKALHQTEDYDRIILVGHSLGSVIAYDIITYLWIDFNKAINLNQNTAFNEKAENDWSCSFGAVTHNTDELLKMANWSKKAAENKFTKEDLAEFQEDQSKLWKMLQYDRKSWLITDLITIGSPLTHAKLLMADSNDDFELRKEEREYPVNPPVLDGDDLTYPSGNGEQFLHHATPFAITRWSNLYYKGDFIGGELSNNFGAGIRDTRLHFTGSLFRKFLSYVNPLSHNSYWVNNSKVESIERRKEYEAIKTLYETMRLNDLESDIYADC